MAEGGFKPPSKMLEIEESVIIINKFMYSYRPGILKLPLDMTELCRSVCSVSNEKNDRFPKLLMNRSNYSKSDPI